MLIYRSAIAILLFIFACALPPLAHAKVTQTGPQNFHNQITLPNAIGKSKNANNEDGFFSSKNPRKDRHKNRTKRHQDRADAPEETRTQTDQVKNQKRASRRDRQRANGNRAAARKLMKQQSAAKTGVNE